ncbi:oncoprotein-induced transcript 3 protein-like [Mercenaria mercenaria]|uniref:oncoprotein-induced transcript 3 protein-like n=1 Tax=Mercenaria mercenaria TaxID=6596 RepID=UPI00234E7850|nr:oncoprotein-induced transcript 3 protein-like [Mercenaria mercenaria]
MKVSKDLKDFLFRIDAPRVYAIDDITVAEGQPISRLCSGDSYPLPFYTWQLPNGSKIAGPSLIIRTATIKDTGTYTCIVYNTYKGVNHTVRETTFIYVLRAPTSSPMTSISATTNLNVQTDYSLKEAVDVACTDYHWFITVDMDKIRNIYPKAKASDIYLGENKCRGLEKGYHLIFQHGLFECLTSEMLGDGMKVYNNELIYAEHDPVYLFIVFSYNWTVGVECDVRQNGTAIGGFPTSVTNSTSQSLGSRQYPVSVSFYNDQDFIREIGKGNPLHAKIGSQVYVKVFTTATDWNIRMRVHTCYTKPTEHAHDHMKYFLIKDGCEVNTNTHIISQSTHATRFVFESFEYSNSHEGIYVFCDAIFCNSDRSAQCRQTCNPVP